MRTLGGSVTAVLNGGRRRPQTDWFLVEINAHSGHVYTWRDWVEIWGLSYQSHSHAWASRVCVPIQHLQEDPKASRQIPNSALLSVLKERERQKKNPIALQLMHHAQLSTFKSSLLGSAESRRLCRFRELLKLKPVVRFLKLGTASILGGCYLFICTRVG